MPEWSDELPEVIEGPFHGANCAIAADSSSRRHGGARRGRGGGARLGDAVRARRAGGRAVVSESPRLGVGFAIPQALPDGRPDAALAAGFVERVRLVARRAEEAGYEGGWVHEQVVGTRRLIEPVVLLAYVAGVTSELELGCSVFILPYRQPVTFAKPRAGLDAMSGG
ncbi:MAG: LLM class flavin-dependent oxidoreductase, partial [Chloroflexi bacterium]|nr:LLM class flavin-dependent oxidoreductase [Chloroflexota bacterium]